MGRSDWKGKRGEMAEEKEIGERETIPGNEKVMIFLIRLITIYQTKACSDITTPTTPVNMFMFQLLNSHYHIITLHYYCLFCVGGERVQWATLWGRDILLCALL